MSASDSDPKMKHKMKDKEYRKSIPRTRTSNEGGGGVIPQWLTPILQGVTILVLLGCAYWLGGINNTVNRTAATVDKLSDSKEKITNRLATIETKLDAMDKKIDQLAKPSP